MLGVKMSLCQKVRCPNVGESNRDLTFNIPEEKIQNIKAVIGKVRGQGKKVKVRLLAQLVGKLHAVRLATGPIVSVLTRSLYHVWWTRLPGGAPRSR